MLTVFSRTGPLMYLNGAVSVRPAWILWTEAFSVSHADGKLVTTEEIVSSLPEALKEWEPERVFQFFAQKPGHPEEPTIHTGSGRRLMWTVTNPEYQPVQSSSQVCVVSHNSQTTEESQSRKKRGCPSLLSRFSQNSAPLLCECLIGALSEWLPKFCLGMDVIPTGVSLMCFSQSKRERISRQAWHMDLPPSCISRSAPPYIMFVGFHDSFCVWLLSKLVGDAAFELDKTLYSEALSHADMAARYGAKPLHCKPFSVLFLSLAAVHAGMAAGVDLLTSSCVWRFHVYLREGSPVNPFDRKGVQQTFPCEKLLTEDEARKLNKYDE
jgi:hypothetical protein